MTKPSEPVPWGPDQMETSGQDVTICFSGAEGGKHCVSPMATWHPGAADLAGMDPPSFLHSVALEQVLWCLDFPTAASWFASYTSFSDDKENELYKTQRVSLPFP